MNDKTQQKKDQKEDEQNLSNSGECRCDATKSQQRRHKGNYQEH